MKKQTVKQVVDHDKLINTPDVAVYVGEAFDGLPLVLDVSRAFNVRSAVLNELGGLPEKAVPENIQQAINLLETTVTHYATNLGMFDINIDNKPIKSYVSNTHVRSMLGSTLMSRILNEHSPISRQTELAQGGRGRGRASSVEFVSGVDAGNHDHKTVLRAVTGTMHLGVPTDASSPFLVKKVESEGTPEKYSTLQFENLKSFPSASFSIVNAYGKTVNSGSLYKDHKEYVHCLQAFENEPSINVTVSRTDVANSLVAVGRKIYNDFHKQNVIHGDVTPSNILLLTEGATPIDPLRMEVGSIAYAGTPGWAAPEQVLRREIVPATDIYPLGLMLVQILEGSVYGEERTFIVPTNLDKTQRIRVISDAGVFIDDTVITISNEGKKAWKHFVQRCISFDPKDRPSDGNQFADELEKLIHSYPLPVDSVLPVPIGMGVFTQVEIGTKGKHEKYGGPAWVLHDSYNSNRSLPNIRRYMYD